ncbi:MULTISPECIES: helix-turn-helix domain-containing protein [Tsukamurella]|uniref:Helix-turn-helix transcriptional regulator n=2 Tax=Tsukamurella TaxID=2060 RepID=A0A5C5S439_9ACTN|nr:MULTISPECIES: helix-turn-helix transcriptional regulator [Tsukamurella]NMD55225.1 helix-turn-helix transcriptional regulator [Tsukamurella columbiensis]TWS30246.1 helix-turn-helix transcriptional regulator [Tsukamurella conjunctivitidis]
MPKEQQAARRRYGKDARPRRTPPHVSIKILRIAAGLTLDDVAERMAEFGEAPARGTLSAIENGHRGASKEFLDALERALGIPDGSITTNYVPRATPTVVESVVLS